MVAPVEVNHARVSTGAGARRTMPSPSQRCQGVRRGTTHSIRSNLRQAVKTAEDYRECPRSRTAKTRPGAACVTKAEMTHTARSTHWEEASASHRTQTAVWVSYRTGMPEAFTRPLGVWNDTTRRPGLPMSLTKLCWPIHFTTFMPSAAISVTLRNWPGGT
jgi:hypothetical protein